MASQIPTYQRVRNSNKLDMTMDAYQVFSPSARAVLIAEEPCVDPLSSKFLSELPFYPDSIAHNAVQPVNKLPTELLSEIFNDYVADDDLVSNPYTPNVPRMTPKSRANPTVLTHVCAHWRQVAVGHQYLWSRLFVNSPQSSHVEATKLWLERAGTHPLTLAFSQREEIVTLDQRQYIDVESNNAILDMFTARAAFWENIDFAFDHDFAARFSNGLKSAQCAPLLLQSATVDIYPFSSTYRYRPGSIPMLRGFRRNNVVPESSDIWRILHKSPVLHTVSWYNDIGRTGVLPNDVLAKQLTHVKLKSAVGVDFVLDLLSKCSNIRELTISNLQFSSTGKGHGAYSAPPIILPDLRVLRISGGAPTEPFFVKLTCPSLQALDIASSSSKTHTICGAPELGAFLRRSQCNLQELQINGYHVDESFLLSLLSLSELQGLRVLSLGCETPKSVLARLANRSVSGAHEVMPALTVLFLYSCTGTHDELAHVASSRWHVRADDQSPAPGSSHQLEQVLVGTLQQVHLMPTRPIFTGNFLTDMRNQRTEPVDEVYLYRHKYLNPNSERGRAVLKDAPERISDERYAKFFTDVFGITTPNPAPGDLMAAWAPWVAQ